MPKCIYFDIDDVRMITFSPITCDHPASITRICDMHDDVKRCYLLSQKFFMYDINTTQEYISNVEIRVSATFPPWKVFSLNYFKRVKERENGIPTKYYNTISEKMLRNIISEFTKEQFNDVRLISINN